MKSLSERSKIHHANHWGFVFSKIGLFQSGIDEMTMMVRDCCIKARIRPERLIGAPGVDGHMNANTVKFLEKMVRPEDVDDPDDTIQIQQVENASANAGDWLEAWSTEFDRPYWYHKHTRTSVWNNPVESISVGSSSAPIHNSILENVLGKLDTGHLNESIVEIEEDELIEVYSDVDSHSGNDRDPEQLISDEK